MKHTLSIRGDMRHYIGTIPAIAHRLAIQDLPYSGARDILVREGKTFVTIDSDMSEDELREKLPGTGFSYES